jgi:hypothetical protein
VKKTIGLFVVLAMMLALILIGSAMAEEFQRTVTFSASGQQATHLVKWSETLAGIAQRYNVSMGVLKKINGLTNDTIYAGDELRLPFYGEAPQMEVGVPIPITIVVPKSAPQEIVIPEQPVKVVTVEIEKPVIIEKSVIREVLSPPTQFLVPRELWWAIGGLGILGALGVVAILLFLTSGRKTAKSKAVSEPGKPVLLNPNPGETCEAYIARCLTHPRETPAECYFRGCNARGKGLTAGHVFRHSRKCQFNPQALKVA